MIIIGRHLTDFFINSLTDLLVHCVTSLCWNVFAHLNMIGDYGDDGDYGDGGDDDGDD